MTSLEERPALAHSDAMELVPLAAELVVAAQLASRSMLSRKLRVRWDQAGYLLEVLETAGVVGPDTGAKSRPVLVAPEDLPALLVRLQAPVVEPDDDEVETASLEVVEPEPVSLEKGRQEPGGVLVLRPEDEVELRPRGELVGWDDDPSPAAPRPPLLVAVRRHGAHLVTTLRRDTRTTRTARAGVRAAWVTSQGGMSWARRAYLGATHGHLREQVRLARLAGDREQLKEWVELLNDARNDRIHRLVNFPKAAMGALAAGGLALGLLLGALLLLGVVAFLAGGPAGWTGWWGTLATIVAVAGTILSFAWHALVWLLWPGVAWAMWREGRRASDPPMWLLAPDEKAQLGAEITADSITAALGHLKITALTKALKEGARLEFVVSPREQGGGTYFQVRLPMGSMAADLLPSLKVELLAANLSRHMHEVWPQRQPDEDARVLDCWIADKGTMDKPAPAWPLLDDGTFNVFRDRVPWGVTMRGEPILIGMLQKHWLIGASSKQGKSTALRSLLLALALDVCVEFRLADLKGDGDLRMFQPMCHTYIEGQAKEHAEAAVVMLEDLVVEMQRRYDEKQRLGIVGPITEQIARRRGSGFHPIFAVVDECQVMYMAGKADDGSLLGGSKDESRGQEAAKRLHDQARAVNIQLMQSTQRPDPQTVPVRVREGVHVRASLYVPNINAAKMILADAAERGARPYDLRPGRDAGTVVVAGEVEDIPSGQAFAIVRTHYVTTQQAWQVAKRAIELRRKAGREAEAIVIAEAAPVDHLANILDAMEGEARVRTVVLLGRLIEMNRAVYEPWGSDDLADALREYEHFDLRIRKSDGQSVVRLEDVSRAIQERE